MNKKHNILTRVLLAIMRCAHLWWHKINANALGFDRVMLRVKPNQCFGETGTGPQQPKPKSLCFTGKMYIRTYTNSKKKWHTHTLRQQILQCILYIPVYLAMAEARRAKLRILFIDNRYCVTDCMYISKRVKQLCM